MKRLLGGAGVAIGLKIATGFAIAAFAAVAAGAATEVAVTGSLNPSDWGKQVTQTVQACKDQLRASGTRGIGPCVSAFAKQHGEQVSDSHKASNARENNGKNNGSDKNHGNGNGNGNGGGNGNGNGNDKSHGKGNGNGNGHKGSGSGGGSSSDQAGTFDLVA